MSIQRYKFDLDGMKPSETGEFVEYEDHAATHAYDEAAEIDLFAIAMVQTGRCAVVTVVTDDLTDGEFHNFAVAWGIWKACAMSRARRFAE